MVYLVGMIYKGDSEESRDYEKCPLNYMRTLCQQITEMHRFRSIKSSSKAASASATDEVLKINDVEKAHIATATAITATGTTASTTTANKRKITLYCAVYL